MRDYTLSLGTLLAVPLALLGAALIAVDVANITALELGLAGLGCLIVAHGILVKTWFTRQGEHVMAAFELGREAGRMHSV